MFQMFLWRRKITSKNLPLHKFNNKSICNDFNSVLKAPKSWKMYWCLAGFVNSRFLLKHLKKIIFRVHFLKFFSMLYCPPSLTIEQYGYQWILTAFKLAPMMVTLIPGKVGLHGIMSSVFTSADIWLGGGRYLLT